MFKNFIKTAFRALKKNPFFSAINIIGLATGFTCCLLIGIYIQHELGYDRFEKKGDRIARVIMEYSFGDKINRGNYTSTKVAPVFKRAFPEIESAIRMYQGSRIVKYDDKLFNEPRFLHADSTFFDIFSFPLLEGNSKTVLDAPNKVVLTASAAKKYFGKTDPVGKSLLVGSKAIPYMVTGIVGDCPSNSQIKFDFLASFSSLGVSQENTYWEANYTTYFLLKDAPSIALLQRKIPAFMKKEMAGEAKTYVNYELEPMQRVHLYSPYGGFEPNNSITYIYIISAIALLIMLIACFTYINLGTASSVERAREIGVRKVMGAARKQIFWQYIGESLALSILSLLLSVLIVLFILPYFNQLADRQLSFNALLAPSTLAAIISGTILFSLIAGAYPALVLSGFQPIRVLKGAFKNTGAGLRIRKSLMVFQFGISVFLIISTMIIQDQLQYIRNKKLGFDREHMLVMPMDRKMLDNIDVIKTEFKTNPEVLAVSVANSDPGQIVGGYNMRRPEMPPDVQYAVTANPVDEEFVSAAGLQIIAGEDLNKQDVDDVTDKVNPKDRPYHFILNESAAKELGWTASEAVGKKMSMGEERQGTVKAVIKDFHFESLHLPIRSVVLFPEKSGSVLLVKLTGGNLPKSIASLEAKWKSLVTHRPFEYHFMDETYNKMYSSELRLGTVVTVFAAIAILLACLGLLGLSSFSAQQRTKEIGIRKILGASVPQIVALLSKEFIILPLLSFTVAFPMAWWAMHNWLQDFAYRINIDWWIFPLTGIGTILLALITILFRASKVALGNPVASLRTE